jgi:hypothetical protein
MLVTFWNSNNNYSQKHSDKLQDIEEEKAAHL